MAEYVVRFGSPAHILELAFEPSNGTLFGPGERVPVEQGKRYTLLLEGTEKRVLTPEQAFAAATGSPICGFDAEPDERITWSPGQDSALVFMWREVHGYWRKFRRFSIVPHPTRSYEEIVQSLYLCKPPRIDVLVAKLTSFDAGLPCVTDEDWGSDSLKGRSFNYSSGSYVTGISVLDHFGLDYETNLHLLWELPDRDLGVEYRKVVHPHGALLLRFQSEHGNDHVLILYERLYSQTRWLRKTAYLLADTVVMLATMLGHCGIPRNELALMMLTWWAHAFMHISYNMSITASRRSSMLLVSDILRRAESPEMLGKMLNSLSRSQYVRGSSSALTGMKVYTGGELVKMPYSYLPINATQADIIRIWNLVRSQLGLSVVTYRNYLEETRSERDFSEVRQAT